MGILFSVAFVKAQELIPSFKRLDRDLLARTKPRYDNNGTPCAIIRVSAANIAEYTFEGNIIGEIIYSYGEALVYMTEGSKNFTIKSNLFGSLKYDFSEPLQKHVVYRLSLKLEQANKNKRNTLILLEGGWHPSQTSYGAMIAIGQKNGAYIRFRSDFNSVSTDYECDNNGILADGTLPFYKEGSSQKARLSITAGYIRRFTTPIYTYIGIGYGKRILAWETLEGNYIMNKGHSAKGIASEIGIIGRFGNFAISAGCQNINFKYAELSLGIGYFFN